jgi:TPR repeat protein
MWVLTFEAPDLELEEIQKRAAAGQADMQRALGHMHLAGVKGAKKSYSEAFKWFSAAAARNDSLAMDRLGLMYLMGLGMPQNFEEAFALFKRSADLQCSQGEFHLGVAYQYGLGVQADKHRARFWIERSADREDAIPEAYWGYELLIGRIVNEDRLRAYRYWSLSAAHGFEAIAPSRNRLARTLDPDDLRRVQDELTKAYTFEKQEAPITVTVLGPSENE